MEELLWVSVLWLLVDRLAPVVPIGSMTSIGGAGNLRQIAFGPFVAETLRIERPDTPQEETDRMEWLPLYEVTGVVPPAACRLDRSARLRKPEQMLALDPIANGSHSKSPSTSQN